MTLFSGPSARSPQELRGEECERVVEDLAPPEAAVASAGRLVSNERTAQNASPNYQKLHARRIPVWDSHRLACPGRGAMTGASPG
ncbi:unnamed protein product [Danaus chrysippus]|uniref:(African queen) hypothetical protein n=1 Tax=Danaus chrysippus TaxID=151541 RepID=A0A8J2QG76_9NEOP|nr:unnamed protein product [Danaus chrysippus]